MGKIFKPKTPKIEKAVNLPQADDEEIRRAKNRRIAEMDRAGGQGGTNLTESKLGDFSQATVRTGAAPSTIVSGA